MKKCSYCGSENEDSGKFCKNCGAQLPQIAELKQAVEEPATVVEPVMAIPVAEAAAKPMEEPVIVESTLEKKNNGLCIAGLIVSLVSLLCCGLTSVVGLILSICGLVSAKNNNQKGKGMAIAGIIISAVATLAGLIFFLAGGSNWIQSVTNYNPGNPTRQTDDDDDDIDIEDEITSQNWVETNSNSYLVFSSGKKFKYYMDYNDTDDYYYEGKYEIYVGEDALEYITEDLEEYDIDEDDIEDKIDDNRDYDMSNLVCLVLKNNTQMIGGINALSDTVVTPYYGFYIADDDEPSMDLWSMNVGMIFEFITEDNYEPVATQPTTTESSEISSIETTSATTSESTAATQTTSASPVSVLGNDTVGHIALTQGNWGSWTEAGGYDPIITSHEAAFNTATGSIINVQVWDTDITPEQAAQASMQRMDTEDHAAGVTGAQVTIGGVSAVQTYGLYPDGTYLVSWFFRTDDGVFHYISVEFTSSDYASFEMVENNYTLN